jgi:hypothetical protein
MLPKRTLTRSNKPPMDEPALGGGGLTQLVHQRRVDVALVCFRHAVLASEMVAHEVS